NWLRCPRLARLEQESDEPREDSPALVKGSLVHPGLAHRYARLRAEQRGEDPDQLYEPHEAIAVGALRNAAVGSDLWHEFAPMAQEVVAAYERYWSVNQWRIVGVEQILRGEVDGFPYTQRADLI